MRKEVSAVLIRKGIITNPQEAKELLRAFTEGAVEKVLEKSFISIFEREGLAKGKDFDIRVDIDEDGVAREFTWGAARKHGISQFAGVTALIADKNCYDLAANYVKQVHPLMGQILPEVSDGWMQFDGRFMTVRYEHRGPNNIKPIPVGVAVRDATMDWAHHLEGKYVLLNEKIPDDIKSQARQGILNFVSGYCRAMTTPVGVGPAVPKRLDALAKGFVKPFEIMRSIERDNPLQRK